MLPTKKRKFLKITGIIFSLFILLLAGIYIYFAYFFDLKSFEKTIKNKVYSVSGKYLSFDSITFSFKHGIAIKLKNLKLLNKDNSTIFSTQKGYINLKIISLFKKKIKINKIYLENGCLVLKFSKSHTPKKKNIIIPPNIKLKELYVKNFNVIYIDSHLNIKAQNLFLQVENFSFNNFFKFKLKFLCLTKNNLKGNFKINGEFNFNSSFSPEKMILKAHIIGENIYGKQFYSYFVKKAHFKIFKGDIENIDSFYNGNLKGTFSSRGKIKLKNFSIQHEKFKKPIFAETVQLNYFYKMNKKDIQLKEFNIFFDNKIKISGYFNLFNYKNNTRNLIIKAKTSSINITDAIKYSPYSFDNLSINSGKLTIDSFILKNKNFSIKAKIDNISGKLKFLNFKNLTGIAEINNKFVKFSGILKCNVNNFQVNKDFFINNITSSFNFKKLKINLKNFNDIIALGLFNLQTDVSFKNYKNIKIICDNGFLQNDKILSKFKIFYNNIIYNANGIFTKKDFRIKILTQNLDTNLLKKLNIDKIKNLKATIEIGGFYKKPQIINGILKFNKGIVKYKNFNFNNILGQIECKGNTKSCKINNLSFYFNKIFYNINGKIENFLNKKIEIFLNISANGIHKDILKKINLKIGTITNIKLNSNIHVKIFPKVKLFFDNCSVKFNNSSFRFLDYFLENVKGKLFIYNKNLYLDNITFISNAIKYNVNGTIYNIFNKKETHAKLFINSNGIDRFIFEKLNLGNNTLNNINLNGELFLKFYPTLKITLSRCKIKFLKSNFQFKNYKLEKITGKIVILKNILKINNLNLTYNNIRYKLNGKLLNIYNKNSMKLLINVKTDTIDKDILKHLNIDSNSIKNSYTNINLKIKFFPKFKLEIPLGKIKFSDSIFILKKPYLKISKLNGNILIKNNNLYFRNISGKFKNGTININGKLEKNYINITLSGKDINLKTSEKFNNPSHKKKKKEKKENKIVSFIKEIKKISEKFNGEIIFKFDNVSLKANSFKIISGEFKLNNKILSLKNAKVINSDNGSLQLKKFLFDFSTKINQFMLKAKVDKFNPYDFTMGKISGITKGCIIDLSSKFTKPENFTKNLNGLVFISIKNGYIYKFIFLSNLFSILNVSQIFKFKLPELSAHGLKYKIIAGKFDVLNGIFKTDKFILVSDSINLGFKGKINSTNKNIKGEIVVQPLQTIGNIIGKVPLLGYIFGRKIILIYFKVTGSVDNPKIMIQPSKTITKKTFKIFKNIFKLPKELFTNPEKIFLPGVEQK